MDFGLRGKRALVGAASKGLGRACALGLAREGARVAICARHAEALERTAQEIGDETGAEVMPVPVDLSDAGAAQAFADQVIAAWGGVDVLVNNAGGPPPGPFVAHDDAAWRAAFELNFMSTVTLTRAVIPGMRDRHWGRVLTITSVAVKQPVDGLILSNAVRAGVTGLCRTLANELGPDGITVNCVCPGFHLTDRVRNLAQSLADAEGLAFEEAVQRFAAQVPLRRVAEPQEFGDVVTFLASERAGYITGQSILVDGGTARGLL